MLDFLKKFVPLKFKIIYQHMKTLIFAAVFCASCFGAKSQTSILLSNNGTSSTLAANEVIFVTIQPETNEKVTIDIKNTGPTTQSYNAKRYDVLLNADATSTAQAYFCIAGSCYGPPTMVSPTPLTLNSMQSASQLQGPYQMLVADLDEASTKGFSHVKYTFQNVNNPNDSVQISIKYNAPQVATSIAKLEFREHNLRLSPVPASGNLNVAFEIGKTSVDQGRILVFNSEGKIVYEENFYTSPGSNYHNVDVREFPSGIYYFSLQLASGSINRKIVINN